MEVVYALITAAVAAATWSTWSAWLGFCDVVKRQQDHENK